MLRIALPLVMAEVGWMSMGLVDTVMVGHLPQAAVPLSAASLAQILYNTFAFGIGGVLLGLDTTVSQAHGAGDYRSANKWIFQGIVLCVPLTVLLMLLFSVVAPIGLRHLPTEAVILDGAIPALRALSWGTFPLLLYFALRRYLQAFNHVRIVAATLISANVVNVAFNWLLIFGHSWHVRVAGHLFQGSWSARGVVGSGMATSLARVYQALFLIVAILVVNRKNDYGLLRDGLLRSLRPDWVRLRRLVALGAPSGATILIEVMVFAVVISFTFMIPLGISAAASVRVGQAIGRGSVEEARSAGWAAIALGAIAMLLSALTYLAVPYALASAFTRDQAVIAATVPLLFIAAFFQFCDGLQVTVIGALRGAGDTHSGLVTHLCTYWLLGLPLGLYLCFTRKLGARGLWIGLSAALIVAGVVLVVRWRTKHISLRLAEE